MENVGLRTSTFREERNYIQTTLDKRRSNEATNDEVCELIAKKNRKIIFENLKHISDDNCSLSRMRMWQVKKKISAENFSSLPVGKYDKNKNIVSNPKELKKLYVHKYKERLRHRKVLPEFSNLKEVKENLFSHRLQLSKQRKSPKWMEKDL